MVTVTFPFVGTHTADAWAEWDGQNHAIEDDAVSLATADRRQYVDPSWILDEPPLSFSIVDLAIDDCGDLWLLTAGGTIYRYDPDRAELRRIHCTWDDLPANPRAIAVTADTIFVAIGPGGAGTSSDNSGDSVTEGARIHGFSRHSFQTRWIAGAYTDPVALASHGNSVTVLDGGDGTPFLAVVGRGGDPVARTTGFRAPVDLAVDTEGDRYVLDGGGEHTIERVPAGDTAVETVVAASEFVADDTRTALEPDSLAVGLPDELLVGIDDAEPAEPSLFRHDSKTATFERLTTYTGPVTGLFLDRRGDPVLYVVGAEGTSLSVLSGRERTRQNPDTGRFDGQVTRRLDSGEWGTQWHRVTTEPTTPSGTQIRLFYHATDDANLQFQEPGTEPLTRLEQVNGIGPAIAERLRDAYVQGLDELVQLSPDRLAEIAGTSSYPVSTSRAADWIADARQILANRGGPGDLEWQSVGPPNPEDSLLDDAEGRYLWLKIELIGTPADAPRVASLRAYFPRQSYLRYLPAIFQEDQESAEFLERFLSLFESVFTDVEEEISAATRYLDPDGIPGEALSWLAGWLALAPDETWTTEAKRKLVRDAHELFKQRGTRQGLRALLSIYLADRASRPPAWQWAIDRQREAIDDRLDRLDELVTAGELSQERAEKLREHLERSRDRLGRTLFIWEQSDFDCIEDDNLRQLYEGLVPCKQCFAVFLWPSLSSETVSEVERLVESTRPAHAVGRAIQLQPRIQLTGAECEGVHHTYLGVNSVLADREYVLEQSTLGTDTRLTEREPSGQYGVTERLGIDTNL